MQSMRTPRSVGIVGLGLIGGSLARDLAAQGIRVHGCDRDTGALRAAMREGVVHAAFDGSLQGVGNVDALVLAVPLTEAVEILQRYADRLAHVKLVTDVCSTKQTIAYAAARAGLGGRFIGGHPLAGDHASGWQASRTNLFEGATVYVCPPEGAQAEPLALLRGLWRAAGATTTVTDPAAHDRLLAWTSHLPQAVATALARVLTDGGISGDRLGRGGRDMTRLAASSPDIWTPTAMDNAAALCDALAALETDIAAFRGALERGDREAVRRFFTARVPAAAEGTLPPG